MKIAVVGSAPHCAKAPFGDPTWEIWGANVGALPRWDRWFDLHDDASIDTYPDHRQFLATNHGKPVYVKDPGKAFPYATRYPVEAMSEIYGTWFLTSTIAYMLAMAMGEPGVTDIGLWGVDMAHASEYEKQKPGCRFFIQAARMAGITVTIPPEAEVGKPGHLYGYSPPSQFKMWAEARVAELQGRAAEHQRNREMLALQRCLYKGALEIAIPHPQIVELLRAVESAERQAEKDALVLDGGVQNAVHVLQNWTGD